MLRLLSAKDSDAAVSQSAVVSQPTEASAADGLREVSQPLMNFADLLHSDIATVRRIFDSMVAVYVRF